MGIFKDYSGMIRLPWFILMLISSMIIAIIAIRQLDYHYSKLACSSFGIQSGYKVKWADYNYLDYGCLIKTSNGHWIDKENLQNVSIQ